MRSSIVQNWQNESSKFFRFTPDNGSQEAVAWINEKRSWVPAGTALLLDQKYDDHGYWQIYFRNAEVVVVFDDGHVEQISGAILPFDHRCIRGNVVMSAYVAGSVCVA